MAKLHELLAVSPNLQNQAAKATSDVLVSFDKKKHLFGEQIVTFTPKEEGAQAITEARSDLQETVHNQVDFVTRLWSKVLDVDYQMDVANTQASADVILEDGTPLLADVPATTLLELETRLKSLRDFAAAIPTLDPAKGFVPDMSRGKGIFKAREVQKNRTKKEQRPMVLYPATDKHPAQVQVITEDIKVGTITEQEWSALITPATKSDVLDRCDMLLRAVKKARSKANEQEIDPDKLKIGKKVLNFVFEPLTK